MDRRRFLKLGTAGLLGATQSLPGLAQEAWPARPIRLVVPFAPGGTTDLMARILAAPMSQTLGQQIVIDNRAGAGGTLGTDLVAKSPKDGYTLAVGTVSTHAIGPALMRNPPYRAEADFTPVAVMATTALGVFIHPSVGATTLAGLQEKARAKAGQLNFGSPGSGSPMRATRRAWMYAFSWASGLFSPVFIAQPVTWRASG